MFPVLGPTGLLWLIRTLKVFTVLIIGFRPFIKDVALKRRRLQGTQTSYITLFVMYPVLYEVGRCFRR